MGLPHPVTPKVTALLRDLADELDQNRAQYLRQTRWSIDLSEATTLLEHGRTVEASVILRRLRQEIAEARGLDPEAVE